MNLTIDLDSDVPIYQQIRDRVVEAVARGEAKEGDPLPSTRRLATDFGINFHTVNKAYDLLRQEGVIRVNRKSGAVIRRDARSGAPDPGFGEQWHERMRVLLAEASVHGVAHEEILRQCAQVLAGFGQASVPAQGKAGPRHEPAQGKAGPRHEPAPPVPEKAVT
ncbi:DNA-binding transcriptional regulator YhcF (GntR family) [Nonomuraea thailandensis]|uniref:DNA-binding transcriptional regulator YhcF (GntR family) n=1 Tax=Nonomuraea thailandensis TaxID=1188745 RepID=A0A9X2K647_9ACTN|nr:GntR family transcriptional regulator [Nonomuraea thailandensis]MCP2362197.1 DNA-binding transcriptional regulator YhcF (GntR family) [Nonomuraea thailandensis]